MNIDRYFKSNTVGGLLKNLAVTVGIILFIAIIYFYIYLPNVTHHGQSVEVPDLMGLTMEEAEKKLAENNLSVAINDSSYAESEPALSILKQFPKAGEQVKEGRTIYVSINRTSPPTMPMPNLIDGSLINAEAVLKSNELRRGRIIYEPSPFQNFVKDMYFNGRPIAAGTRIPKGATIDIVVGDGNGSADFVVGGLVGDSYETALLKISNWNLHLGEVQIAEGQDTTGVEVFVYKQFPNKGDSVRMGSPIDLWIAPKGYKEPETENP
ncbi:MAG: PASTA domain-containing protein [Cyclobacteriaceae bacterium]|jgi:beta-lactam-binding protein with PASTA domain